MGKGQYEKIWKDAFDGAELIPSAQLWTGIEAGIANEEATRYKRGIFYYKWLAAAGVLLFAGLLGYISYNSLSTENNLVDNIPIDKNNQATLNLTDSIGSGTAEDKIELNEKARIQTFDIPTSQKLISGSKQKIKMDEGSEVHKLIPLLAQQEVVPADNRNPDEIPPVNLGTEFQENQRNHMQLTAIKRQQPKTADVSQNQILAPVLKRVSGVPIYKTDPDPVKMVLWAGVSMVPGYFDPNYQSQGLSQALKSPNLAQNMLQPNENHRTGFSMSFGFEMGMRLSDKWQLSSGLQYLNNNVQSSTNAILDGTTPVVSSVIESLDLRDSKSSITFSPTELDNTFQFLSIPLQAGYLMLDRRVKLHINAGFTSDIFLKNTITAVDQSLESVTINPGASAPFKSVYFNGLVGAKASFEFLPRYMITLEPRYKWAISDFTRSESLYTSQPSSFGIGVGVKFTFK